MKKEQTKLRSAFIISVLLLLLTVVLVFRKEHQKTWKQYQRRYYSMQKIDSAKVEIKVIRPTLTNEPELCLTCHIGIEEISPSHPVESFGCVICHGGEPMTLDKHLAHKTMRGGKNPSGLQFVEQSCSRSPTGIACHNGFDERWRNVIDRVNRSLLATACGAIAFTRYTFGLQKSTFPIYGTREVTDDSLISEKYPLQLQNIFQKVKTDSLAGKSSTVEKRFVKNCLTGTCHLNTPAVQKPYFYRSTGCATCHYLYETEGYYQGKDPTISRTQKGHGSFHRLTTAIPFNQCNHCHNRGIYSLKEMRFLYRRDLEPDSIQFLSAQKHRQKEYYIPLAEYARCEVTLECIDCHTHNEVMGNGHIYPDKKEAIEIECQTCHGTLSSPPRTQIITYLEQRDVLIASFNPNIQSALQDTVVVTKKGTLLPAVRRENHQWILISKIDGRSFIVPQVFGSQCKQDPKQQDSHSCHRCHDVSEAEIK